MDKNINWLFELKKQTPLFLEKLKGKKRKGFYHYSLSGDYFGEGIKWGLGNSVFFLKIIYTLNLENEFESETKEAIDFIKSFQKINGGIYDSFLNFISLPFRIRKFFQTRNFNGLFSGQTKRAETRQAFSALNFFNEKTKYPYLKIPKTKKQIEKYLEKLNWNIPWGAGSHFSHLLFFLNESDLSNKKELIEHAIFWINKLQNHEDGFWYKDNPDMRQKINGAMKIITGLQAIGQINFKYAEKIIDNCLGATNDIHACDNFNIVYVLKNCFELTDGKYRTEEIRNFMLKRLEIYRQYYHEKSGGFSFKKNKANRFYYDALVGRGKNEPDIHGTVMFLWGISLIAQVLGINDRLNFKEFKS